MFHTKTQISCVFWRKRSWIEDPWRFARPRPRCEYNIKIGFRAIQCADV